MAQLMLDYREQVHVIDRTRIDGLHCKPDPKGGELLVGRWRGVDEPAIARGVLIHIDCVPLFLPQLYTQANR